MDELTPGLEPATTTGTNSVIDCQYFLTYINDSAIELGYFALVQQAKHSGTDAFKATILSQTLFIHFVSPSKADVFVNVNLDALLVYQYGGRRSGRLDPEIEVLIGLPFGVERFYNEVQKRAEAQGVTIPEIPVLDVAPFVEQTRTGYCFSITFHNLMVLWLNLEGLEVQNYARLPLDKLLPWLRFASLFDNVTFQYDVSFVTDEESLTTTHITAQYFFGSTDLMMIPYLNTAGNDGKEEQIATFLNNQDLAGNFKRIQNIQPNPEAPKIGVILYSQDLAKWRIKGSKADTPDFSLSVLSSTNIRTIGDSTIETDGTSLNPEDLGDVGRVTMKVGCQKAFETDYETKVTYDLVWANGTRRKGMNVVNAVIPVKSVQKVTGLHLPYFQFQRSLFSHWLRDIAQNLTPQQLDKTMVTSERYFIANQFPFWSGGQIIHYPNFTAYSNPEGIPEPILGEPLIVTEEPLTTTEIPVIWEFPRALQIELLLPVLTSLVALRRRSKRQKPIGYSSPSIFYLRTARRLLLQGRSSSLFTI